VENQSQFPGSNFAPGEEQRTMLSGWTTIAEQLIRAAQDEGQFDNLPGFGKPIPGIDDPHDEFWWIKAKLKREQLSIPGPLIRNDSLRRGDR
jgi:hypothetical protein